MFENRKWHLQIFAEEATAEAAAPETAGSDGAAAQTAAETAPVQEGQQIQQSTEPAAPSATAPRMSFRELLQDEEYRREYEESVGRAVKRRMRSQQKMLAPMLETLGQQYGIDTSAPDFDMKALVEAVTGDESRLEQEAMEHGYTVEDWKTVKESRRIVAEQRAASEEADRARFFSELEADGQLVKAEYPDFNYEEAMLDPAFGRLVVSLKANGTANPVQAAYKATHFDAIMKAKVAQAEEQARQSISQTIQSGMNRPREAGTAQATAQMKIDPRNLSEEQRKEIRKRIARGEHVTFG